MIENDFFKDVTRLICGSLDIDKALKRTLLYLIKHLPLEAIALAINTDENDAEFISYAFIDGRTLQTYPVPNIPELRKQASSMKASSERLFFIPRAGDIESIKEVSKKLQVEDHPCFFLDLVIEDQLIGMMGGYFEKGSTFSENQFHKLKLLNEPFAIALSNYIRFKKVLELRDISKDDNSYLRNELINYSGKEIIGSTDGLKQIMKMVNRIATKNSPVLLLGETGVGKEIIASSIHKISGRREKPFITVNCGAIPDTLIDSELFGYEKGAFTGASDSQKGKFERADTGTIFLDEIGELPLNAQIRLLRVLQENEIERVGGKNTIKLNIRLIAATHRNLEEMIEKGTFREDLYFRLNMFPIHIPPLRERLSDIPHLVNYFIKTSSKEMNLKPTPSVSEKAIRRLMGYNWPGNVRELKNAVERALILYDGKTLSFDEFADYEKTSRNIFHVQSEQDVMPLDTVMKYHIDNALKVTKGKIHGPGGAAELLKINPMTLTNRMIKLNIQFGKKKNLNNP